MLLDGKTLQDKHNKFGIEKGESEIRSQLEYYLAEGFKQYDVFLDTVEKSIMFVKKEEA